MEIVNAKSSYVVTAGQSDLHIKRASYYTNRFLLLI